MKHYRILEKKEQYSLLENKMIPKQFTIQYLKKAFFGFYIWKKLNDNIYTKYDLALTEIKKVIKQEDYETALFSYHYVDAYKIFKSKEVKKEVKKEPSISEVKSAKRTNTSVFVPKQK